MKIQTTVIKNVLSIITALSIATSEVFLSSYIAITVVNKNENYMKYINEIKREGNIVDKFLIFSQERSVFAITRYLEVTADTAIKLESIPSMTDHRNFLICIGLALNDGIVIDDVKLKKGKMILYCIVKNMSDLDKYITQLRNFNLIEDIYYKNLVKNDSTYALEIHYNNL